MFVDGGPERVRHRQTARSAGAAGAPANPGCDPSAAAARREESPTAPSPVRPGRTRRRIARPAHRGTPFQLQAGPGTGKTRTLVKRILSLLEDGVDPASILVLTFSNRAAGELAERVSAASRRTRRRRSGSAHSTPSGSTSSAATTTSSSSPPDPALFDRSDAIAVLEEILPTLPLVHYRNLWDPALVLQEILSAISRAKDELVDDEGYRALAKKMRGRGDDEEKQIAAQKCLEIADVYERYERRQGRSRGRGFRRL